MIKVHDPKGTCHGQFNGYCVCVLWTLGSSPDLKLFAGQQASLSYYSVSLQVYKCVSKNYLLREKKFATH